MAHMVMFSNSTMPTQIKESKLRHLGVRCSNDQQNFQKTVINLFSLNPPAESITN